jgi:hypothetical protein
MPSDSTAPGHPVSHTPGIDGTGKIGSRSAMHGPAATQRSRKAGPYCDHLGTDCANSLGAEIRKEYREGDNYRAFAVRTFQDWSTRTNTRSEMR